MQHMRNSVKRDDYSLTASTKKGSATFTFAATAARKSFNPCVVRGKYLSCCSACSNASMRACYDSLIIFDLVMTEASAKALLQVTYIVIDSFPPIATPVVPSIVPI